MRRSPSDRKSTRLNSSHITISYAVFCLKKKKKTQDFVTHQLSRQAASKPTSTVRSRTGCGAYSRAAGELSKRTGRVLYLTLFFCSSYGYHRDLHSFPTRRSSDLHLACLEIIGETGGAQLVALEVPDRLVREREPVIRGGRQRGSDELRVEPRRARRAVRILVDAEEERSLVRERVGRQSSQGIRVHGHDVPGRRIAAHARLEHVRLPDLGGGPVARIRDLVGVVVAAHVIDGDAGVVHRLHVRIPLVEVGRHLGTGHRRLLPAGSVA